MAMHEIGGDKFVTLSSQNTAFGTVEELCKRLAGKKNIVSFIDDEDSLVY
jgi:hypothetical protein